MRLFNLVFITTVLAVTGINAIAQITPGKPIRIGLILPLTSVSADSGNSSRVGAQLAVAEINQAGGYLGQPFELLIRDDKGDPDTGLKAAEELVLKEKVTVTMGICNSGVAMKTLDVFQKNKSILFVTCATGTGVTAKYPAAQSYIFRNAPMDVLQTQFIVNEIAKRGYKRVAMLVDSSGYGNSGLKDLEAAISKAGLPPPKTLRFNLGVKSVADELQQLRQSGADVLISWTVGTEQGVISASRAAIGWKVPVFGPWGLSHASALEASSGAVEGALMPQSVLPNFFLERNTSFISAYSKRSTEKPMGSMMAAAQTYDAVQLLLRAMFESKGNFSGDALKTALENLPRPYYGVVTTYDKPFSDSDHDAISMNMLWLGTWRNGERAFAYKEDERRASIIRRKEVVSQQ